MIDDTTDAKVLDKDRNLFDQNISEIGYLSVVYDRIFFQKDDVKGLLNVTNIHIKTIYILVNMKVVDNLILKTCNFVMEDVKMALLTMHLKDG